MLLVVVICGLLVFGGGLVSVVVWVLLWLAGSGAAACLFGCGWFVFGVY